MGVWGDRSAGLCSVTAGEHAPRVAEAPQNYHHHHRARVWLHSRWVSEHTSASCTRLVPSGTQNLAKTRRRHAPLTKTRVCWFQTHEMTFENSQRYSTLWLDDGNIILVAGNTGFKVHWGILARHSETFRDMFSLPQPQPLDEVVEGCPVIRIAGEDSEKFAIVTEILYGGGRRYAACPSSSFVVEHVKIPAFIRTAPPWHSQP